MREKISALGQKILAVLRAEPCHLSAEELGALVPQASPATVYRSLERLNELGLIRRVPIGKQGAVWEAARAPHIHLVCRGCGRICDVPVDLTGLLREILAHHGAEVESAEVTVHGLCGKCAARQKNPPETGIENKEENQNG